MDPLLEKSLLFDFYGELLTGYQKEIYEDFTFNDLSLGEIAADHDITRQGVHTIVKRTDAKLLEYEKKLKLVEKFLKVRELALQIQEKTKEEISPENMEIIRKLTDEITDIL